MENIPGYLIIFLLVACLIRLIAWGIYRSVKAAVKSATREYEEEKHGPQ